MKVLWFAAAVLTAVLLFVWWSSWYMEEVCNTMRNFLELLPEGEGRDLRSFGVSYRRAEEYWFSRRLWIQMIVGKKGAQEVCGRLVEMGMRYIGDDMVGYNTDREKLKLYLEELAKSEKVSWEGVL